MVSHCTTVINREGYVGKLKEYINITQYGRCSGEECSRKNGNECFEELAQTHMFYIAFENSICEDYATEKFYRSLFNPGQFTFSPLKTFYHIVSLIHDTKSQTRTIKLASHQMTSQKLRLQRFT